MAHAVDITSSVTKIDPQPAAPKPGKEKMVWVPGEHFSWAQTNIIRKKHRRIM